MAPIANDVIRLTTAFIQGTQASSALVFVGAAALFGTVRSLLAAILHGVIQMAVLLIYLESRFPGFWYSFNPGVLRNQLSYAIPWGRRDCC
jgi:hypothetical protein